MSICSPLNQADAKCLTFSLTALVWDSSPWQQSCWIRNLLVPVTATCHFNTLRAFTA